MKISFFLPKNKKGNKQSATIDEHHYKAQQILKTHLLEHHEIIKKIQQMLYISWDVCNNTIKNFLTNQIPDWATSLVILNLFSHWLLIISYKKFAVMWRRVGWENFL